MDGVDMHCEGIEGAVTTGCVESWIQLTSFS